MGINLTKGQGINLTKDDGSALKNVFLGAGWDAAGGGIFGFGGGSIDLDASLVLFDEQNKEVDSVWFGQLRSKDGSISHSGDNRTGDGDGDDETIKVDLQRVPANVKTLVFTISSFRGQSFKKVKNAYVRLVDAQTGVEIAKYNLAEHGDYTSLIVAKVYRHNGEWKMKAIGESCQGTTIRAIASDIARIL